MSDIGSLFAWRRDPRLAAHALSSKPVWVWSPDASRIIWANPIGAAIFDSDDSAALAERRFGREHPTASQIARLAASLPHASAPRLERLRGFGAGPWRMLLCACSRIALPDRTAAILVVATEPAGPGLSLAERVRRVLTGCEEPIAVFSAEGALLHATSAMQPQLAGVTSLGALGAGALAADAMSAGAAEGNTSAGKIVLERLGVNGSAVLLATLVPQEQMAQAEPDPPAAAALATPGPPSQAAPVETSATVATDVPPPVVPADTPAAAAVDAFPRPDAPAPPAAAEVLSEPVPETSVSAIEVKPDPPAIAPTSEPEPQARPPATAPVPERRTPLRFVWQMDADSRFTIGPGEFTELIGPRSAAALGRTWTDVATELAIDPEGQVKRAMASRETWSGVTVDWPVDGAMERLAVELSGLPIFDRDRDYRGYRGFGVCRDMARLNALLVARRDAPAKEADPEATVVEPVVQGAPAAVERPVLTLVPAAPNVVPFRGAALAEIRPTPLSPVERKAFRELARQLTARLKGSEDAGSAQLVDLEEEEVDPVEPAPTAVTVAAPVPEPAAQVVSGLEPQPASLQTAVQSPDLRPILDRLPVGVLVYRLDQLLYANQPFLDWSGYGTLDALAEAGGMQSLFAEPGIDALGAAGGRGGPLAITTRNGERVPVEGRLFSVAWSGEQALMLSLAAPGEDRRASEAAVRRAEADARELKSILDTATDGVIVLDRDGRILATNRSAVALFGYEAQDFTATNFLDLFAPESQRVARDYLDRLIRNGASVINGGREVAGCVRKGGMIPLFMTIGRLGEGTQKFCAVFRDVTQWKKAEEELLNAKRQAEKASSAKSEFLAKISHEIRTPLNAIIGFSEVMMEERFGPIGNDRYREYLKDIHTSGAHLVSLLNDLLDLSKIEAGKLELTFVGLNLNHLTQQCVALMQPQANRERIIIRSSLSPTLPQIVADARSIRQIVLNLVSNSIKFTDAGGQVIVSTAHADNGEVVLRVRDTGIGMSEKDVEIALEPFRQLATSARWGSSGTGLGLPLTKALAEANRARFSIKSAVNAGTLVEIAFPPNRVLVE
jgi:PAS domain S-box-containing protein